MPLREPSPGRHPPRNPAHDVQICRIQPPSAPPATPRPRDPATPRFWWVLHYPHSCLGSAAPTRIIWAQGRRRGLEQLVDTTPNRSAAAGRRTLMATLGSEACPVCGYCPVAVAVAVAVAGGARSHPHRRPTCSFSIGSTICNPVPSRSRNSAFASMRQSCHATR